MNIKENRRDTNDDFENWTGRWMPDRLGDPTPPPKVYPYSEQEHDKFMSRSHDIYMGYVSPNCDDAKTNLTVDWDHSVSAQTCYGHHIEPSGKASQVYCEYIPKAYEAAHKCMNETIEYDDDIPLYGPHRPLWPVYGEYMYLPKQRWLHSLEHGAVVMLYHPCANPLEVNRLKSLVSRCLWRHIITPCSNLDEDYPLALLSWGCKLSMSYVNPAVVRRFIQTKALRGPERTSKDGQFTDALLKASDIVTDPTDSYLCP
ncbi:Tumor protein p53-inducible protein 13 [Harpegnathos saltator]|uniref:Tumor protein p53-inducible protein 13 n=1 Tax=Harpegnathos saltator TaxID=610380 RepID=E2BU67_HARSA|nr:Tumor protein p53-inducible protein 13 [Harpegnathos saltator]